MVGQDVGSGKIGRKRSLVSDKSDGSYAAFSRWLVQRVFGTVFAISVAMWR